MMPTYVTLFSELLREVGHAAIEVHGSSMLPVILPGDVLKVEAGQAALGDIVVFIRNDRVWAHRVIAISGNEIVTRGDANPNPDASLHYEEVLGRVSSLARNGTVLTDLQPRPKLSRLLGNWPLVRRMSLRVYTWRRDLHRASLLQTFTAGKSQG